MATEKKEFPIKVPLEYPIKAFGEELTEIEIKRRPITRDLRTMDEAKGEVGKSAALLAQLTDLPQSSIDAMDAADFARAADEVAGFLA